MILPMLVIWDVSARAPSHVWELANDRSLLKNDLIELFRGYAALLREKNIDSPSAIPIPSNFFSRKNMLGDNIFDGNNLYNVILKKRPIIIANGMLLLLSLASSDILILINININKNNIETAPTYTNK